VPAFDELCQPLHEPCRRGAIHDVVVEGDRGAEDVPRLDALFDDRGLAAMPPTTSSRDCPAGGAGACSKWRALGTRALPTGSRLAAPYPAWAPAAPAQPHSHEMMPARPRRRRGCRRASAERQGAQAGGWATLSVTSSSSGRQPDGRSCVTPVATTSGQSGHRHDRPAAGQRAVPTLTRRLTAASGGMSTFQACARCYPRRGARPLGGRASDTADQIEQKTGSS
jgi:hypothetical protein